MITCKLLPSGESPWRHTLKPEEIKILSADTEKKAIEQLSRILPTWAMPGKVWSQELDGSITSTLWVELRMRGKSHVR